MTLISNTLTLTNTEYETLDSLLNDTLVQGNKYALQIQNIAYVKIADAEFTFKDEKFQWTQGSNDVYVKATPTTATLTILESE